jgi:hypothetical protein
MGQKKRSKILENCFFIEDGLPYLKIICNDINTYNLYKNKFIVNSSLAKINSNIELSFIDAEDSILAKIRTNSSLPRYRLAVNGKMVVNLPLCYNGEMEDVYNFIYRASGFYLQIAYLGATPEEFIICVKNVLINDKDVRLTVECNKKLLKLPEKDWYKDGTITPGGLGVGWVEDADNEEEKRAVVILQCQNQYLLERYEETLNKGVMFDGKYASNLSVIIEDVDDNKILIQIKMTGKADQSLGFELKVAVKVSGNYSEFKKLFNRDKYAWIGFQVGDKKDIKRYAKTSNIIFIDSYRQTQLTTWVNPIDLALGGVSMKKKVLINSNTLEVGIYKYFSLEELDKLKLRMIVNELVGHRIGIALDLPVVDTTFHMEDNSVGIISRLIPPPVFKIHALKDDDYKNIVDDHKLVEMIAFDIFLCHRDRHSENVCVSIKNEKYYPYLIDHGNCLGGTRDDSLNSLRSSEFQIYLELVGLGKVAEKISRLDDFSDIVNKIQTLDIAESIRNILNNELQILLTSYKAYDVENVVDIIIDSLTWRQKNIKQIISSSLFSER